MTSSSPELLLAQSDRRLAAQWLRHNIPLETVRRAIQLGCLRKSCTMIDQPHSPPIRSLHYFQGVRQEVRALPVSDAYWRHVEFNLRRCEQKLASPDPTS